MRPSSSETGSSSMHELFCSINDVSVNMQPPAVVNVCTDIDSIPNNLTNDTCVSYATFSGADISASGQTPAEQQGSYSDSSLSQGGDYTSVYSSLWTDDASMTINGMSDDTGSSQSSSKYLLDLGLKCKGFRMGHINIQGISNKIDQVRMLLESDKNQIHVLGLSETKLNDIHPDSAFQVNGFQKPFRWDREANSGGGILVYEMVLVVAEGLIWNIKILNVYGSKLSQSRVNLFFYVIFTDHQILLFNGTQPLRTVWKLY